jgi:hypothetical protein
MSSRILTVAALTALCISGCAAPANGPTNPATISDATGSQGANVGNAVESASARLFWRPNHLFLKHGEKRVAKLFSLAGTQLNVADNCTGRVSIDQIGVARVKRYHIAIYQVQALQQGPFRCGVVATTQSKPPLHALLRVLVRS